MAHTLINVMTRPLARASGTLKRFLPVVVPGAIVLLIGGLFWSHARAGDAVALPSPVVDSAPAAGKSGLATVVFAGGCFWGVQAVFQHVKGVADATSGYSGGAASTAKYDLVSGGDTGHAESVKVTFDPRQVSYGQLLKVFFSVAHDPTELNRQGPDEGTQYRSVVFFTDDAERRVTEAYVRQLDQAKLFHHPIVTQIVPLQAFYPAEGYHQNYARLHPDSPYIVINDAPKVVHLRQLFPQLYQGS
jgi:peptide-methionine (S)-S-oxide reductase